MQGCFSTQIQGSYPKNWPLVLGSVPADLLNCLPASACCDDDDEDNTLLCACKKSDPHTLCCRSERVQGKEPTNYNERALAKLGLDDDEENGRRPRLLRGKPPISLCHSP